MLLLLVACSDNPQTSDDETPPDPTDITPLEVPALGENAPPDIPIATDDERYPVEVPSGDDFEMAQNLYEQHCAECHGISGEGQQPDPTAPGMAPPHNESGHTWHHPDDILFRITKQGTAAVVGGGYVSDMPGFGNSLTDEEIRLVLAYIKSTWPQKIRESQQQVSNAR